VNWSADHAGFVAAAYAISGLAIAGLLVWVIGRDRKSRRDLRRHDKTDS
jgi:heme exporter protein CcmD